MSNTRKGEVSIEASGKTYTLAANLDSMVSVEELFAAETPVSFNAVAARLQQVMQAKAEKQQAVTFFDIAATLNGMAKQRVSFDTIMEEVDRGSAKYLRGLLWALLQKHHPDVKIVDVADLVTDAGGLQVVARALLELAKSMKAETADLDELNAGRGNPPNARTRRPRGTGARSTSKRAMQG